MIRTMTSLLLLGMDPDVVDRRVGRDADWIRTSIGRVGRDYGPAVVDGRDVFPIDVIVDYSN